MPCSVAQTIDKGHGRIEVRRITVVHDTEQFIDWPGVPQLFKLERQVTQTKQKKTTTEVVYALISCAPEKGSAM